MSCITPACTYLPSRATLMCMGLGWRLCKCCMGWCFARPGPRTPSCPRVRLRSAGPLCSRVPWSPPSSRPSAQFRFTVAKIMGNWGVSCSVPVLPVERLTNALRGLEDAFCAQAVEVLRACNVQLVLCQWGLSPLLCHALATHQIAVVTWIPGPGHGAPSGGRPSGKGHGHAPRVV